MITTSNWTEKDWLAWDRVKGFVRTRRRILRVMIYLAVMAVLYLAFFHLTYSIGWGVDDRKLYDIREIHLIAGGITLGLTIVAVFIDLNESDLI